MNTKPGWKTTEFWLGAVLPQVVAFLALSGKLAPEAQEPMNQSLTSIAALITSLGTAWRYIKTRGDVKVAATEVE